jgi:hypothetical protein
MAFTDNFTDTDTTTLETHTPSGGTAWTRVDGTAGGAKIVSNILQAAAATNTLYICDDQGNADQYVQYKHHNNMNDFVCNRATDSNNFIGIRVTASKVQIYKRVTATFTQLGSTGTTTVNNGDIIRLESSGNVHTAKINGNLESGVGGTDAAHNTVTRQGICARTASALNIVDDFEAGTLSGTVALTGSASTGGQTAPSLTTSVPL